MNCQEFTDQLPDYLDETLDAAARADAQRHLEDCRECQLALRRTQALGRSLQCALNRETAHLVLSADTRKIILRAAHPIPVEASAGRSVWQWLFGHPMRAVAAAGAMAAVLLVAVGLQRQRSEQRADLPLGRYTWSVDVPFQSGRQVGLIHADFSEVSSTSSSP
jgi:anti-sigma factor RsiW